MRNDENGDLKLTKNIKKSRNSLACFEDSNLLGVQIVELKDDSSITGDLNQILAPESQIRQDLLSILTDDLYDFDKNMDKKNYKKELKKYIQLSP